MTTKFVRDVTMFPYLEDYALGVDGFMILQTGKFYTYSDVIYGPEWFTESDSFIILDAPSVTGGS